VVVKKRPEVQKDKLAMELKPRSDLEKSVRGGSKGG